MMDLPDSLPAGVRRAILRLAFRGMTLDQRRAAGILPGRLVLPADLQDALAAALKTSAPTMVKLLAHDGERMVLYGPADGEVVRIAPEQQRWAKTCCVLSSGRRWSDYEEELAYAAVLTGICPGLHCPPVTARAFTTFLVVGNP